MIRRLGENLYLFQTTTTTTTSKAERNRNGTIEFVSLWGFVVLSSPRLALEGIHFPSNLNTQPFDEIEAPTDQMWGVKRCNGKRKLDPNRNLRQVPPIGERINRGLSIVTRDTKKIEHQLDRCKDAPKSRLNAQMGTHLLVINWIRPHQWMGSR